MTLSILVVSEDRNFAVEVQDSFAPLGIDVSVCLGPANTPCRLDGPGVCPLARRANVVVVDGPSSGAFHHEWSSIPTGDYARRLAHAHPGTRILLVGAPEGSSRPADALAVRSRSDALSLIDGEARPPRRTSLEVGRAADANVPGASGDICSEGSAKHGPEPEGSSAHQAGAT